MKKRTILLLPLAALTPFLNACSDNGVPELRQWMTQVRQETHESVRKVDRPKQFSPFAYESKDVLDPFDPKKLAAAFAKLKGNAANALKPDLDRRREPLEAYPLDVMKMVGTLQRPGLSTALLQIDKMIYQVKMGNYVGQNLGMVIGISDAEVEIKEVVQDATGDWVERRAKLALQEIKK